MLQLLRCTNVQEYVFGLSQEVWTAEAVARAELIRHPSDQELFAVSVRVLDDFDPVEMGIPLPALVRLAPMRWSAAASTALLGVPNWGFCLTLLDLISAIG